MRRGNEDCTEFWKDFLSKQKRKVLFILGQGFDPRMNFGLRMLLDADPGCIKKCILITYNEGNSSPSHEYKGRVDKNIEETYSLMSGKDGSIQTVNVKMISADGQRRTASRSAGEAICNDVINGFDDIIVDISSMPRSIYFPIITKLLYLLDEKDDNGNSKRLVNFHVLVAEEVSIDGKIQEEGIDDKATYMHGFSSDLVQESIAKAPKIWIPVLGEGKIKQLQIIFDQVKPDEICPVFPSPSVIPRRSDELIREYHELLFDSLQVEPSNFIYVSEWNPFEVYRQIIRTIERYNKALVVLGKCKIVVSALTSKLLSVGTLLAAYEAKQKGFKIGISHVEAHGYRIHEEIKECKPRLYSLWIAGECYNA